MDGRVPWRHHIPSLDRCFSLRMRGNGIFTPNLKWSECAFTWRISRDPSVMTCRLQVGLLLSGTDGSYKHTLSHSSPLLQTLFNSEYYWCVSTPFKSQHWKWKVLTGMLFASFRWKKNLTNSFISGQVSTFNCRMWMSVLFGVQRVMFIHSLVMKDMIDNHIL